MSHESIARSRVMRGVATIEVIALVGPDFEGGLPADLEGIVRGAISEAANDAPRGVWLVPGEGDATDWEELEAK